MVQKQYEVVVKYLNEIIEQVWEDDYDRVNDALDRMKEKYGTRYRIEFIDHQFTGKDVAA